MFAPMHECLHLFVCFCIQQSCPRGDASIFEDAAPVASHGWVWIAMGDHDFLDTGPHQRFRARRGTSKVVAGLQRHIGG